jgi:hypothetical protein
MLMPREIGKVMLHEDGSVYIVMENEIERNKYSMFLGWLKCVCYGGYDNAYELREPDLTPEEWQMLNL